ncbi:MAG: 4-hydroxy-tetrahydrodipicolinate synthase [Candidatus Acidiferrales bacterium]
MMHLDAGFLRGSYPPVITPFRRGRVDLDTFAALLDRQVQGGSHGIVVTGTTGEPSSLTIGERCELFQTAVGTLNKRLPVVAATGSQSLAETLELTNRAEKLGADAVLVVTPYYIRPPQRGLIRYFVTVAKSTSLPVLIYHIPGRACVTLTADTIRRIAEQAPNVVGLKHAANDLELVSDLLISLGQEFRIFCGLEALSFPMMAIGAAGTMNAVANLDPERVATICNAVMDGDLVKARRMHLELFGLNQAIFRDTNPIPLKYMMARVGLLDSAEVRPPLDLLGEKEGAELDTVLRQAGLLR